MLTRRNKVEQEDSQIVSSVETIKKQQNNETPSKVLDEVERVESLIVGGRRKEQQRVGGANNKESPTSPLNFPTQQQNKLKRLEREQRPIYSISRMTQMARVSSSCCDCSSSSFSCY